MEKVTCISDSHLNRQQHSNDFAAIHCAPNQQGHMTFFDAYTLKAQETKGCPLNEFLNTKNLISL